MDIAGLAQFDIPVRVFQQAVGVGEVKWPAAGKGTNFLFQGGRGLGDQRVGLRRGNHPGKIAGGGEIFRVQAGRIGESAAGHTQGSGLLVHLRHKGVHAAWVGTAQRRGGAVFRRHECQQQQFTSGQGGTHGQARAGHADQVAVGAGDSQLLIQVELGVQHHHGSHELGNGGDGAHGIDILAEDYVALAVEHDGGSRAKVGIATQVSEF